MKKIVLATILLLSCLSISCSQEDYTNKSERELRKGYKEAKVYAYLYKFGKIDKSNKVLIQHFTYDGNGNISTILTRESEPTEPDEYTKEVYKYNQVNMPIQIINYDGNGQRTSITSMKYYPGDTIIAEKIYNGKNSISEYKYNEKGTIIYETHNNDFSRSEDRYDDKGNQTYRIFVVNNLDNGFTSETFTENVYNEKNELVQKTETNVISNYRGEKKTTNLTTYTDEHGDIIASDDKKYNEKGQLVEETTKYSTLKYK